MENCRAIRFMAERNIGDSEANPIFFNCCRSEKLTVQHIQLLQDQPSLLRELLTGSTPREKRLRKSIVKYKNALCMASVHANWVSRGEGQSGFNPTVTVQGRIYHFLGALQPAPGRRPAFLSVYIHDTNFEVQSELRSQNFAGVDRALLTRLASMLNQHNTYVQSIMSLHELARDNSPTARYKIVIHADKRPANEHVRRYSGPSSSEVAALIPGNEDGMIGKRDILVRKRGQANSIGNEVLDKVSISRRSYDPLSYVMLFLNGTDG